MCVCVKRMEAVCLTRFICFHIFFVGWWDARKGAAVEYAEERTAKAVAAFIRRSCPHICVRFYVMYSHSVDLRFKFGSFPFIPSILLLLVVAGLVYTRYERKAQF